VENALAGAKDFVAPQSFDESRGWNENGSTFCVRGDKTHRNLRCSLSSHVSAFGLVGQIEHHGRRLRSENDARTSWRVASNGYAVL